MSHACGLLEGAVDQLCSEAVRAFESVILRCYVVVELARLCFPVPVVLWPDAELSTGNSFDTSNVDSSASGSVNGFGPQEEVGRADRRQLRKSERC